uniref:Uncharacterized protein n=1 Tax=Vibrio sp. FF_273 TaxID=1652830 RepID=A0A0H3ZWY0_9VIBR|nr:hypothetical protein [Vibrio sp. FF_273]
MYSEETLNKLIQDIKNDLDSKLMTTQGVFCKYISKLIAFKRNGFSYSKMHEHGQFSIGKSHFYNLIHKAKTKRADTQANAAKENRTISALDASHDEETKQKQTQHEVNPKIISHFSEADWKAIGINNDYLISVLLETDLSPDEVKSWNCPNQIQLSTRISEYRHRKMKRK